ncbi:hypothetical protein [Acinetobacter baumannii]|uniref:hypothetical protein n=1 Tax=Acinetobacter baumannii TaxID=470 RepID=UPI00215FD597|nr:hypothetical protein [Acinetobacter baumannii]
MDEFEEYYKNSEWFGTYQSDLMMKEAFEAGQQSMQAKVEELQKRVDALEKTEFKLAQVKAILQNNPKLLESILVKKIEQALKGEG